ncbi:MAG: cysteine desulfurase family protein [bacterium]
MALTQQIYLDNHATTPCDPRVVEAMLPYYCEKFGNPASRAHAFGWDAEEAVEEARQKVAELIGARPKEIIFTSGATESNNLAIKGVAAANGFEGEIITVSTEHVSILDCCGRLQKQGLKITRLPVDKFGMIDLAQLEAAINDDTILISVMAANNEIGTLANLEEIGNIARRRDVFFHTDAAQAFGKIPLDVEKMNLSLLSFTAHKIYGPKGTGGLYVRSQNPRVRIRSLLDGGGHERGLRSGTLNVPAIVGMGKASEICAIEMAKEANFLKELTQRLESNLRAALGQVVVNGHPTQRLPGNLNVCIPNVESQSLLAALGREVAFSSGSACAAYQPGPSHVLQAIGLSDDLIRSSVRFGIGRFNSANDVDLAAESIARVVHHYKKAS